MIKAYDFQKSNFTFICFILFLSLSPAFVDYTSSGLENPLAYFLFSLLIYSFHKEKYLTIPILAALLFLTRFDYFLIIFIFLIVSLYKVKLSKRMFSSLFLSASIVFSWLFFSLYYYGTLFPNTYYAKMMDYDFHIKLLNSLYYYKATLLNDPVSSFILLYSMLILLPFIFFFKKRKVLNGKDGIILLSIIPYLVYIIWIGGDFMQGRFFSIPILLAAPIFIKTLSHIAYKIYYRHTFLQKKAVRGGIIVIAAFLFYNSPALINYKEYVFEGILPLRKTHLYPGQVAFHVVDEKAAYFPSQSIIAPGRKDKINLSFSYWKKDNKYDAFVVGGRLGILGLAVGKNSSVIDMHGLTDPFIARIRVEEEQSDKFFTPGHKMKNIPLGYFSTVLSQGEENYICDGSDGKLRDFYNSFEQEIQAPLELSFKKIKRALKRSFMRDPFLYKNIGGAIELDEVVKLYSSESRKKDLNKNTELACRNKLQNLFLQTFDKEDLSLGITDLKHWINVAPGGPIRGYASNIRATMHQIYIVKNAIYDLSAKVLWGPVSAQCFEVTLDVFNKFYLDFLVDGKSILKKSFETKNRKFYSTRIDPNHKQYFKTYRACFDEYLETDRLRVNIQCDGENYRYCSILSLNFFDR